MIKRWVILLILLTVLNGCTKKSDLELLYNPVKGLETGTWQVALLVEMQTNFSSLIFDKTEAKFDAFSVHPFQILPVNCKYYIMPVITKDMHNNKSYDDTYANIIASYLKINGFGRTVSSLAEADYVIMVDVKESPELLMGKNTSSIAISIMELDETPVFFTRAHIYSKSDRNFYYQPSKHARPVKYLTLKGFERIFYEALPQAFS